MPAVSIGPSDAAVYSVAVVSSSATSVAAIAGSATSIIRVYKLFLCSQGTTNLTFLDGTNAGTALAGLVPLVANGSITLDSDGQPWFTCTKGNAFTIASSGGSIGFTGAVYYTLTQFG